MSDKAGTIKKEEMKAFCEGLIKCFDEIKDSADKFIHQTALFYAVLHGQFETAKQLVSFGADVRAKNHLGQTALQYALIRGVKQPMFSFFGWKNRDFQMSGPVALNAATITFGNKREDVNLAARRSLVKTMLNAGANANNMDYLGCSPIQSAVYTGDLELLKAIIEAGADVNSRNILNTTALHDAICCNQEEMVRLLLSRGARVDTKTVEGNTPLHWAALLMSQLDSSAPILRMLLDRPDADVNSQNAQKQTPFHYVMCGFADDWDILARFMELGGDINAKDANGETPLSMNGAKWLCLVSPKKFPPIEDRRAIIELVALIEAKTERPVFDDHNLAMINKKPNLAVKDYYHRCRAELRAMKNREIEDTGFTHFRIMTESLAKLSRYTRDKVLLKQFLEEFRDNDCQTVYPIYGSRLRTKLDSTAATRETIAYKFSVMDEFSSLLSREFQFNPGAVVLEIILKYLSRTDIERLINIPGNEKVEKS